MSSLTLYHFPVSGPSRGAVLAARLVGAPIQIKTVNLMKKEQLQEDFVKLNPQHCVPTLDDNGFILWESRAIARYLADKYGKNDVFYPKDLQMRAIVDSRLDFDSSSLLVKIRAITYPILFQNATTINEEQRDDLNTTLGFLEGFLKNTKWVAGDNVTIADTSIFTSISNIVVFDWDISSLPNIQRWLKQCVCLPGFEESMEGAQMYGAAVNELPFASLAKNRERLNHYGLF